MHKSTVKMTILVIIARVYIRCYVLFRMLVETKICIAYIDIETSNTQYQKADIICHGFKRILNEIYNVSISFDLKNGVIITNESPLSSTTTTICCEDETVEELEDLYKRLFEILKYKIKIKVKIGGEETRMTLKEIWQQIQLPNYYYGDGKIRESCILKEDEGIEIDYEYNDLLRNEIIKMIKVK